MEKEKKVYEVPAMRVHQCMKSTLPLCNSGGDIEQWSRRLDVEDDEDIWERKP